MTTKTVQEEGCRNMKFSVGIFDYLFGRKITLEVPDNKGNIIKQKVTKKWMDKMVASGNISIEKNEMVRVHILDPLVMHPVIESWQVGLDIDQHSIDEYKDKQSGDIYVLISYNGGVPTKMIVKKEMWDDIFEQIASI